MFTIGEFSRLSRVTPRMLRHYDALGLLRPETVGENGYRYYRQEQLSQLTRIQWLKGYGFSLDEEFSYENSDVEVQMVVAQDGPDVKRKPACLCAAVQHRGPYENLNLAYEALCAWLGEHTEYRMCGPAMDRYFGDPDNTPPEALETGVLFPVERV